MVFDDGLEMGSAVVCSDPTDGFVRLASIWLRGLPGNVAGFGARVIVESGGKTWIHDVQNLRSVGQSPPGVHVGLGVLSRLDRLVVKWPDGAVSEFLHLPANRVLTVHHPRL